MADPTPRESMEEIVRELIDFVNLQSGVYMDALAGFSKNRTRVERQVHRITRPTHAQRNDRGERVVVWTSYEDPTKPDVIVNRITPAEEYVHANSPNGDNEQQLARSIVIFIYTFWELEIRPRLAAGSGVAETDIRSDIMGDLRIIRNTILHTKGRIEADRHRSLRILGDMCPPGRDVEIPYEQMHRIFVLIKQECARIIMNWAGANDTAPAKPEEFKDVAIVINPKRK